MIQTNIRKEAENIPLVTFQCWSDKRIKEQFDMEIGKFLSSEKCSEISEY